MSVWRERRGAKRATAVSASDVSERRKNDSVWLRRPEHKRSGNEGRLRLRNASVRDESENENASATYHDDTSVLPLRLPTLKD